MPPVIDKSKCISCGFCADICPVDVLKLDKTASDKKLLVRYPDECWHCRACMTDCPKNAISMRYPLSHMMFVYDAPKEKGAGV